MASSKQRVEVSIVSMIDRSCAPSVLQACELGMDDALIMHRLDRQGGCGTLVTGGSYVCTLMRRVLTEAVRFLRRQIMGSERGVIS